jgi:DNA-binding MarR family transcriptional regulator
VKPLATPAATAAQAPDAGLARFLGYHLKRAQTVLMADMNAAIRPMGLRMITYSALSVVVDNPGIRQSDLADALAVERPNLVVILDDLETRGLIVRDRVPTDRRAYALTPTIKGRRAHDRATAAIAAHEARMLAGVAADDIRAAIAVMTAIRARAGGDTP